MCQPLVRQIMLLESLNGEGGKEPLGSRCTTERSPTLRPPPPIASSVEPSPPVVHLRVAAATAFVAGRRLPARPTATMVRATSELGGERRVRQTGVGVGPSRCSARVRIVGQVPWRGHGWTKEDEWRDVIAHLAAKMTADDPGDQGT